MCHEISIKEDNGKGCLGYWNPFHRGKEKGQIQTIKETPEKFLLKSRTN